MEDEVVHAPTSAPDVGDEATSERSEEAPINAVDREYAPTEAPDGDKARIGRGLAPTNALDVDEAPDGRGLAPTGGCERSPLPPEAVPPVAELFFEEKPMKADLDAHTGLRGFLAAHIVIFHFLKDVGWRGDLEGETSVTPFIVLTGLTLAVVYGGRGAVPKGKFYKARYVRIAPVYYVTTAMMVPLLYIVKGQKRPDPVVLAAQVALNSVFVSTLDGGFFGRWGEMLNGPAWTVSMFLLYWLAFPYVLPRLQTWSTASLRNLAIVCASWLNGFVFAGILVFAHDVGGSSFNYFNISYTHPAARVPLFVAGVAGGVWRSRLRPSDVVLWPRWYALFFPSTSGSRWLAQSTRADDASSWARLADVSVVAWLAVLATALALSLEPHHYGDVNREQRTAAERRTVCTVVLAFTQFTTLVSLTLDQRKSRIARLCCRPAAQFLGNISMSLYLSHYFAIRIWYPILGRRKNNMPIWAAALCLPFSLILAVLVYYGVEEPARKWLAPPSKKAKVAPQLPSSPRPLAPKRTQVAALV